MEALISYIRYELWVCSYWLNCKFQSLTTWWLGELTLANIPASYNNRPFFPSLKLYILYGSLSVWIMLVSCTSGAWSAQVFKFCCQAPLGSWLWPQEWSAFCSAILVQSHLGFLSTAYLELRDEITMAVYMPAMYIWLKINTNTTRMWYNNEVVSNHSKSVWVCKWATSKSVSKSRSQCVNICLNVNVKVVSTLQHFNKEWSDIELMLKGNYCWVWHVEWRHVYHHLQILWSLDSLKLSTRRKFCSLEVFYYGDDWQV